MEKVVIIPTYNEKENIASIITAVFALQRDYHILVIDDGSPDGTAAIVRALMTEYPGKLFLEERSGKLGLGTAYIHGFKWSIARGYDYIMKWMPIFHTIPRISKDYMKPVKQAAPMFLSGAVMFLVERLKTGRSTDNYIQKVVHYTQRSSPGCR